MKKIHPYQNESSDDGMEEKVNLKEKDDASTRRFSINKEATQVKAPRIVYKGHSKPVLSVCVLQVPKKDDTLIITGSEDKTVGVWSLKSGSWITSLGGHIQRIAAVTSFSAEGYEPIAVSASWDETVRIWPLSKCFGGKSVHRKTIEDASKVLRGHKNRIFAITIVHPTGGKPVIASGSADASIRIWSIPEGVQIHKLFDDNEVTWNLCLASCNITPNVYSDLEGTMIVCGCKNNALRVWKLPEFLNGDVSNAPAKVIRGHNTRVQSLAVFEVNFEPLVATTCRDHDIRVWSIFSGQLLKTLKGHNNGITSISAIPTPNKKGLATLVSASVTGNLRVWKYSTGELQRVFNGHTEEVTAVTMFDAPESQGDLIVVSASKDCSARTWLFAQEKSLKVLEHGPKIRINTMDIYCPPDSQPVIVTGADDGKLRAWPLRTEGGDEDPLWVVQAHPMRVLSVVIYTPPLNLMGATIAEDEEDKTDLLYEPLVISSSRDGSIRVSHLSDGRQLLPFLEGHNAPVTSLFVFQGYFPSIGTRDMFQSVPPFLVSGGECNRVFIWAMGSDPADWKNTHILEGHSFDVTAVSVYLPLPLEEKKKRGRGKSSGTHSGASTPGKLGSTQVSVANMTADLVTKLDPIIISAGMDNTVRLWSYSNGQEIDVLDESNTHLTSLAVKVLPKVGPVVAAGDGDGAIRIWSLIEPYDQLQILRGHSDEVLCLDVVEPEGVGPVLVSGSMDNTTRVWDLKKFKHKRTVEGHAADVSQLKVFCPGGSDAALATCSIDTTVRILFDFLGNVPQDDVIRQLFDFDCNGTNNHIINSNNEENPSRWPRISEIVFQTGVEPFFSFYYTLFGEALRGGRSDFIVEFLPLTRTGLLKSNSEMEDGTLDDGRGSLLNQAIVLKDHAAVRVIVDCWIKFLTTPPIDDHDYLYDSNALLSMEDMILLADQFPKEFETLICSVTLMRVSSNMIKDGDKYLFEDSSHGITMGNYKASNEQKEDEAPPSPSRESGKLKQLSENKSKNQKGQKREQAYLFLPLQNVAHMDMLKAYVNVCESLDSVAIFNSDAGQLALSFAWRSFGIQAHVFRMSLYILFVLIATASIYSFENLAHSDSVGYNILAIILIASQLILNLYFVREEVFQFLVDPLLYLSDIWNSLDFTVFVTNTMGNLIRLVYFEDRPTSKVILSLNSISMWFNLLYFLRAFEATGPLVSMILRISSDIRYLIFVVLLVIVGFSQAFWLVSEEDPETDFSSIQSSFLFAFSFMLGGYDPDGFNGLELESFGIFLSCIYMLIVSILLLNLLIALMGDSYGEVKSKGLAQWKFEQAQIITEMQGSISEENRTCSKPVYFRKNKDDVEIFDSEFNVEEEIKSLKKSQDQLQSMLALVLEKLGDEEQ